MHNETFDYARVREWALSRPRKQAVLSFTSGVERDVAYLIEDLDSKPRTISREELEKTSVEFTDDILRQGGWHGFEIGKALQAALATLGITVEGE